MANSDLPPGVALVEDDETEDLPPGVTAVSAPSPMAKGADAIADGLDAGTSFGSPLDAAKRYAHAGARAMTGGIFDPIDLATGKTTRAAVDEISQIVKGGPAMVAAFRKDPSGTIKKLPGAMAGSMMETYGGQLEGKPLIQSERPLASTGDAALALPAARAAKSLVSAGGKAANYAASKTPFVKSISPARVTEKIGRGVQKRARELRAEKLEKGARTAEATASKLEKMKKGQPAWSEAQKAEATLARLKKERAADSAIQAAEAAEKELSAARTFFKNTKDLRAGKDPMIAKSASAAGNTRVGLADDIMRIDEQIRGLQHNLEKGARTSNAAPVEAARAELAALKAERSRIAAEHMGNLRKAIKTSPYTPKVEAARGGMYKARTAAREAGDLAKPVRDSFRQKITAAEGQKATSALARDVAEESLQARKIAEHAKAGRLTERGMGARESLKGAPPSLTNWGLKRLNRIVPGEREVLSESALAMGGGGARGTILATALHGVGEWAASPARLAATARRMISAGKSAQDVSTVLRAMGDGAAKSGKAGAVGAVRVLMESGQLSSEDAADLVAATVR